MALTKLKLQACEDAACKKKIGSAFSVMFNPEKYSRSYTADLEEIKTIGSSLDDRISRHEHCIFIELLTAVVKQQLKITN